MSVQKLMSRTIILTLALFWIGWLLVAVGATSGMSRYIYSNVDFPAFIVSALSLLAVSFAARKGGDFAWLEKIPVGLVAVCTLAVSMIGTHAVYLGYAFSPDEWMPRLQAEIFAHGALAGNVPTEWREYGRAMYHDFAFYDPETGAVASSYRPGMAALIALFDLAGLGLYVSAFMTAGSVLLTASLARILWPDSKSAPVVAALLVATSSQALAGAMTSYAMAPHLFFNLLWLRLFLLDKWWAHVAAALCGVFTASLHQVHPHVFFAAPFFLLLLRPFRPGVLLWYGAVYAIGHLAIIGWDRMAMGDSLALGESGQLNFEQFLARVGRLAQIPNLIDWATIVAHLVRFFAWQSLALAPLLIFTVYRRAWPPLLVLMAASIATSLLPYPFLLPDQGHGWGYRYLHGLIGSLALIGTAGWVQMESLHDRALRRPVMLCFAMTLAVIIPVHAFLIERTIAPWLAATKAAQAMSADVVIVDRITIFYGLEIPRNGPYAAERPVVMMINDLSADQIRRLCRNYRVAFFGPGEAQQAGIPTRTLEEVFGSLTDADTEMVKKAADYQEKYRFLASGECARLRVQQNINGTSAN
ncbi:MAG: hypothetical protein R3D05_12095 [Dongiaceae bacterium]